MKKYNEIANEIKAVNRQISELESLRCQRWHEFVEYEQLVDSQITQKILINNARVALFYQVMPVALEILTKYKNRPYGDKTRQKISDAVKEKTGCRFYIGRQYSTYTYNLYPDLGLGTSIDIQCGPKYVNGERVPLLINNKISVVMFDELELYYISAEYVENIPDRITELKKLHKQAVEMQQALHAVCESFNNLAGDITHIYEDKYIPRTLQA